MSVAFPRNFSGGREIKKGKCFYIEEDCVRPQRPRCSAPSMSGLLYCFWSFPLGVLMNRILWVSHPRGWPVGFVHLWWVIHRLELLVFHVLFLEFYFPLDLELTDIHY